MERTVKTLEELKESAQIFIASLTPQAGGATLVTLSGELGAGKTAFTQAVARTLGITDMVTSPTFVLEKIYMLPEGKSFKRLIHIDAYRLSGGAELKALAFDELMQDEANLIFLEWPERVADALPPADAQIAIALNADGSRILSYA